MTHANQMIVLGLDTATLTSGIALVAGEPGGATRVLAEGRHDAGQRTADLLVAIDEVCRRAGVAPAQLDAVAVGAGPGSFTGLRIGMATAKGIAFAAGRPLWLVSSLAALAHDARAALAAEPRAAADQRAAAEPRADDEPAIAAVLDARRGEVFAGCYRRGALLGDERVLAPGQLAPWIAEVTAGAPVRFAGDALAVHEVLAPLADRWLAIATPSGAAVAQLALAGPREDMLASGAPSYIRPSEAEVMYPDGVPGALRKR